MAKNRLIALGGNSPTNGAVEVIDMSQPYVMHVDIEGVADLILHAWNCESVEAKAGSAKGSKGKKSDDVESYVRRNGDKEICVPGEYLRMACCNAAKFRQDPRSPRKSAFDMCKAGFVVTTQLASLGATEWDYLHKCRAVIQRNAINRVRPAFRTGWKVGFDIQVLLPEYIDKAFLHDLLTMAGRLIGVGDFRPTYGRFVVTNYEKVL